MALSLGWGCVKGLGVAKVGRGIGFGGVWAELGAGVVSGDNHSQDNWEGLDIFLIIPNFLTFKSQVFL